MNLYRILKSGRNHYIVGATLAYAVFALLWIFLSDQLLAAFTDISELLWLSTAKGIAFVIVTSVLLFFALRFVPTSDHQQFSLDSIVIESETPLRWPRWMAYVFAVVITLAIVWIRQTLPVPAVIRPLMILFMFPIILSAVVGGGGPGLAATGLAASCVAYFAIAPTHSVRIGSVVDLLQLSLLVANGILVSLLCEILYRALRRVESAQQLQAVTLACAGDAIISTDKQGCVTLLNAAAEQLTGWSRLQAAGQPLDSILKLFELTSRAPVPDIVNKVLSVGSADKFAQEALLIDCYGAEHFIDLTGAPIRKGDGTLLGVILTCRDDTERKRMEMALREQTSLLQEMSEVAQIGGWEYNPVTQSGSWTEQVALIHEVSPREEVDDTFVFGSGFYGEKQEQQLKTAMGQAISDGVPYDLELELTTAQNRLKWVRIVAVPIKENGRVIKLRGAIQDITHRKQAEEALQQNEMRLARVIEGSDQGFWELDLLNRQLWVSPRYLGMLGYPESERSFLLDEWRHYVHPDDLPKAIESLENHLAGLRPQHQAEFRARSLSGEWKWVQTRGKVVEWDKNGTPILMAGTHTDITERKRAETALRQAATVFESTQEGVLITDANECIVMANRAFCQLTGYSEAEVLGKKPSLLSSGRNSKERYAALWADINTLGYWQGELWNRRKNGEIFPVLISINAVKDDAGVVTHYVSVFMDISTIKASQEQLDFLAHHDPLTQLPNRRLLFSQLEHDLAKIRRDGGALGLLMFDLDRFKDVNDSFGHLIGDQLLQQVAMRLSTRLRSSDAIARLGGDEFTVLLDNLVRPEDAARVAEEIMEALSEPFHLAKGVSIRTSASIGISFSAGADATAESLLQQADSAMYRAKAEGRGRFQYFSENMTVAARERIDLDSRLRRALEQNEFRVYYQPQVDIRTGHIIGAEALVRWQDPHEGLILPGQFIPIAEETGLIREIGEWVLREACLQGKKWLDAGLPPLVLAVNVSARQIHHGNLIEVVEQILGETGFSPRSLELELTESTLMERKEEVDVLLNSLRARRIRLAIDDFGTGYSSLSYLKRFPLDVLKIDKSFIDDISHDSDDRTIIKAIIEMGHTLGFKVLAEGVESAEQLVFLQSHGCDLYQGYFRSKPLPADAFEHLLKTASGQAGLSSLN